MVSDMAFANTTDLVVFAIIQSGFSLFLRLLRLHATVEMPPISEIKMNHTELMQSGRRKESYSIDYKKSALIVIDMVEGQVSSNSMLMQHYRGMNETLPNWFLSQVKDSVIPKIQKVLSSFRKNNGLIIHTTFCSSIKNNTDLPIMIQLGNMIYERPMVASPESSDSAFIAELQPLENEMVMRKSACNAFEGTVLEKVLRRNGIETLVLVGVFTNMCVTGTARSAFDKGFDSLVIGDACCDMTPYLHDSALASLEVLFSDVCKFSQLVNA
jgi:nicotinamidase-related amidase